MSQDLLTQLVEYGEFCEETQWSVTADEVFDDMLGGVVPLRVTAKRTRPRSKWLVAGMAAAFVLVLGMLTFIVRVTAPEAPVLSQPSPSPTVSTPLPLPSTAIEESASGWSRIPHDEAVFGVERFQFMSSVTTGGPGFVAVGESDSGAAVWTSFDGLTWSRVPHDEAVFGGEGDQRMWSVTAGGPGLVAVGWDDCCAAVWTSVDGLTWSQVPNDEAVFGVAGPPYDYQMYSVTAGGPGLVAVGMDGPWDDGVGSAAVWTSVDGLVWSRVPHDEAVFGGPNSQAMLDVTVGGPGLVAVGGDHEIGVWDDGVGSAAVWTSVDGLVWSRVPHDEATLGGQGWNGAMLGVTAGGPGLVAGGWEGIWTSVDGLTWAYEGEVGGFVFDITAGGPGLVAVGSGVWTSVDGIVWSHVDDEAVLGDLEMGGVTVGGPGLVAVGGVQSDAVVWVIENED